MRSVQIPHRCLQSHLPVIAAGLALSCSAKNGKSALFLSEARGEARSEARGATREEATGSARWSANGLARGFRQGGFGKGGGREQTVRHLLHHLRVGLGSSLHCSARSRRARFRSVAVKAREAALSGPSRLLLSVTSAFHCPATCISVSIVLSAASDPCFGPLRCK
jgi:hypothetical protein